MRIACFCAAENKPSLALKKRLSLSAWHQRSESEPLPRKRRGLFYYGKPAARHRRWSESRRAYKTAHYPYILAEKERKCARSVCRPAMPRRSGIYRRKLTLLIMFSEPGIAEAQLRRIFPSKGFLCLYDCLRHFDLSQWQVKLCGFTRSGWENHSWAAEQAWIAPLQKERRAPFRQSK